MPTRLLLRMKVRKIIFLFILLFWLLPILSYALPTRVYLNETQEISPSGTAPVYINHTLYSNLTINDSINLTFEARLDSNSDLDVQLTSSTNKSNYLLRIQIDDQGGPDPLQQIERVDCSNTSLPNSVFYSDTSGGLNFANYNSFTIIFYPSTNQANITVNGNELGVGTMNICGNVTEIGSVSFIEMSSDVLVKNRTVIANNKPPQFIGNIPNQVGIPNITWSEDTSTSFNISGNFSDANNDTLTFSLEAIVENITINVNLSTGIVNLTPNPDFVGVRYVRFIANDSDNITFTYNLTLNVTNINDLPSVNSAAISNLDDLNRTNGTLTASWTFDDKDQDTISANETLWYINGIENESLRNSTNIGSQNTTKNQNWSFSVRVNDGTGFSNFAYSNNLTIQNALQAFSHALSVETVERGRLFTYDVNYTDLDNDNITFSDNTTLFNINNEGIINFTPIVSGNMTINITLSQNPNVSSILTIDVQDSAVPEITSISTSSSGTSTITVTLSVTTDETAQCRFATSDLNFTNMGSMSSTNSLSHSNSQSFSSDTSGIYYVRCNDTIGNVMNFSNSTAFNADVQESSGDSSSSSGGGGGGGWQCRYVVQCTGWSECVDSKQTKECSNVEVVPFYSPTKCEYLLEQETERECSIEVEEAEEELEVPEPVEEVIANTDESESVGPTGAAIFAGLMGKLKPMHGLIALGIIAAIGIGSFAYFRRPSSELTEEEMERLHKMMEKEYLKAKEQDRIN